MITQILNGFLISCDGSCPDKNKLYAPYAEIIELRLQRWGWGFITSGDRVEHYCSLPCKERIEKHKLSVRNALLGLSLAAPLKAKYKGIGGVEVVKCPACGGKLVVTVAKRNGHTTGTCQSTEGCVHWIE